MDKQIALNNLKATVKVLDNLDLDYFLTDGILLGAIRESDFIEHDTDIDIGVFSNQIDLDIFIELVREMMKEGFLLYHSFGKFSEEFEVAFFKDGIKLDLFFYHIEYGEAYFHAFLNGGRQYPKGVITYSYSEDILLPLRTIKFKDHSFKIPKKEGQFLVAKYGKDWKTPVKKWDWAKGPKNIKNIT